MTHDDTQKPVTLEGLARLLEIHGSDRSRWPARERLRYTSFIAESASARRLVAEAEALDRLLDSADDADAGAERPTMDRLTERIMIAAGAAGAPATAGPAGNVTPLRPKAGKAARVQSDRLIGWPAAALLAASLLIGVFVGQAGLVEEQMSTIMASSATDLAGDDEATDTLLGKDEEDVL